MWPQPDCVRVPALCVALLRFSLGSMLFSAHNFESIQFRGCHRENAIPSATPFKPADTIPAPRQSKNVGMLRLRGGQSCSTAVTSLVGGSTDESLCAQMVTMWELAKTLREQTQGVVGRQMQQEAEAFLQKMAALLAHSSALLRHEVCYALGQTGLPAAAETLISVLSNTSEHAMVRHEAAEALAAVGAQEAVPLLRKHCNDSSPEVVDTCRVALDRLAWEATVGSKGQSDQPQFSSIDPAPSLETSTNMTAVASAYCDSSLPLFQRYRALFALRDAAGADAARVIARGLSDASALFRHEVAFVLGQLGDAKALGALEHALRDRAESAMVRHEAAEAIGSFGRAEGRAVLEEFLGDAEEIVAQSCEVALEMSFYWSKFASSKSSPFQS